MSCALVVVQTHDTLLHPSRPIPKRGRTADNSCAPGANLETSAQIPAPSPGGWENRSASASATRSLCVHISHNVRASSGLNVEEYMRFFLPHCSPVVIRPKAQFTHTLELRHRWWNQTAHKKGEKRNAVTRNVGDGGIVYRLHLFGESICLSDQPAHGINRTKADTSLNCDEG